MAAQIPLGLYLWTRIRQIGTRAIMGVPGDMNLELLDNIKEVEGLSWVGNANELNAAYAADGYARVKNCPGVIATTMGVGELSALNGIGGAYTEEVKVIHVVGTTSTDVQSKRLMIHHNLGPNPDHRVFEKISRHVRCAHTWLENQQTAPAEIDRVIRECMLKSLPVYIYVPMDFVHVLVPASGLEVPIDLSPPVNTSNERRAIQHILDVIVVAKNPVVLVDCLAARHGASQEAKQLVDALDFPIFSTSMGKSIIDETHPKFCGIYNGEVSYPGVKQAVESSDCIINLGPLLADSNTGGHTRQIYAKQVIMLEPMTCTVFGETYQDVYLAPLLQKLLECLKSIKLPSVTTTTLPKQPTPMDLNSTEITQSWIWKRLGDFVQPGDILIAESGTAQFGFPDAKFPSNLTYITQVYYGSIGYSVGCCLGAAIAQKEIQEETGAENGRIILVVGDGSLQLTVQEIGTMIKLGLIPILIVINNNGYTIERAIHGPDESYNDISTWRHQAMLEFFGAKNARECSYEARTKGELDKVLQSSQFVSPKEIQLLELFMRTMDVPWRLKAQIDIVNARSKANQTIKENSAKLCAKNHASAPPTAALIGGTGYIGKMIIPHALAALKSGRFSSFRILSSRRDRPLNIPPEFKWYTVDYNDVDSIQHALRGCEILISTAGMQKSAKFTDSKDNIITSAASAGVKVYIPSEFGTDYTQSKYRDNALFLKKAAHAARAKSLGLRTVSIFTGLTMERSFLRWVARDATSWRVVGSPDTIVALTSDENTGKYAVETALLAYNNPDFIADHVRVSSCDLTIRDYALLYEKVRGTKIVFDIVDPQVAQAAWEKRKDSIPEGMLGPLIGIMVADGTFDHRRNSSNDALAKQAGGIKLTSFEEYLAQTTDCPWVGRALELD